MYAIRSYYVLKDAIVMFEKEITEKEFLSKKRNPNITLQQIERLKEQYIVRNPKYVITSYSIHYTKLYDSDDGLREEEKAKIKHAEKFFGGQVKIEFKTQFTNNKIVDLIKEIAIIE